MCYLYHSLQKTESKRKNKSGIILSNRIILSSNFGFWVRGREREREREMVIVDRTKDYDVRVLWKSK